MKGLPYDMMWEDRVRLCWNEMKLIESERLGQLGAGAIKICGFGIVGCCVCCVGVRCLTN